MPAAVFGMVIAAASPAAGDDSEPIATVSGSVGAGMFGADPAGSVDLGVDVAGDDYAFGVGGRVRWIGESGVRTEDWDDASEIATLIRYGVYRRSSDDGTGVSAAAGQLGGATVGHGAVFDGYTTGLEVDARRLGLSARAAGSTLSGELLVDDVVTPRVAGARGAVAVGGGLSAGLTGAIDGAVPDGMDERVVPIVAMDVALGGKTSDDIARGDVYLELAAIVGTGAGLHTGTRGQLSLHDGAVVVGGRLEGRAHTRGYVPGWFGPLYEIERRLAIGRIGDSGAGLGAAAGISVELPGVVSISASYDRRAGLADQVVVRASAPHFVRVQLGLWAAANLDTLAGRNIAAGAAELRVRLPRRMFVGADAARLYRDDDTGLAAIWVATAWVGAVLGEPR